MSDDLNKIKARLDALRSKTVANGCTEDEAIAAANKAAELLQRHGLTEDDLIASEFTTSPRPVSKRSPLEAIYVGVARFSDCKFWYATDEFGNRNATYFGRVSDVLVAEYVHNVLMIAATFAARDFRKSETYKARRKPKTRAHAIRAFQEGFAASVVRKLDQGLWRRYGENARSEVARTASMLEKMAARQGVAFNKARKLAGADGAFRDQARARGFAAGANVDVNAPVNGPSNRVAGLLK